MMRKEISPRNPGDCGGIPRRDGSGGGQGNNGTPRQPRRR